MTCKRALGTGVVLFVCVLTALACDATTLRQRRADRFYANGDYANAASEYEALVEESPNLYDGYLSLGLSYENEQEYTKACTAFAKARDLRPLIPDPYEHLGLCLSKTGQGPAAREAYEKLFSLSPVHATAHADYADLCYELHDYATAERQYRLHLEAKPDDLNRRVSLGATLVALGHFQGAIDELRRVLKEEPKHLGAHYNLGVAALAASQNTLAIRAFTVVTETDPSFIEAWVNLAATQQRMGATLDAIDTLNRAFDHGFRDFARLERDPDFTGVRQHPRYQELKAKAAQAPAAPAPTPVPTTPAAPAPAAPAAATSPAPVAPAAPAATVPDPLAPAETALP